MASIWRFIRRGRDDRQRRSYGSSLSLSLSAAASRCSFWIGRRRSTSKRASRERAITVTSEWDWIEFGSTSARQKGGGGSSFWGNPRWKGRLFCLFCEPGGEAILLWCSDMQCSYGAAAVVRGPVGFCFWGREEREGRKAAKGKPCTR